MSRPDASRAGRPRAIPHLAGTPDRRALETWLATRLHARHRAEPVRTLEALAAAMARAIARAPVPGVPSPDTPPGSDPRFAVCRRVARRALCAGMEPEMPGATRYHHESVEPSWARKRTPLAALGGFLFHADAAPHADAGPDEGDRR